MMNSAYRSLFIFFILLVCAGSVSSIGIIAPPDRNIVFKPLGEVTLSVSIVNAEKMSSYVDGDLKKYATIIDPNQGGGPRTFQVVLHFPQSLPPGRYSLLVGASEAQASEATVGALAAIQAKFTILVLYPGIYLEYGIGMDDVNVNETKNFSINVLNLGTETASAVQGSIDVYSPDDEFIATLSTDTQTIQSNTQVKLNAPFTPSNYQLKPGIYHAVAHIKQNGETLNKTQNVTFTIGNLLIHITDSTKEVFANATNKYSLSLESDWAADIHDVYAIIHTPNHLDIKTPNTDLIKPTTNNKKATASLQTYWETNDLATGNYSLSIDLHYEGKVTTESVPVSIIEGKPPAEEKPQSVSIIAFSGSDIIIGTFKMPLMIFLMIILIVIVLINLFVWIRKKNPPNTPPENSMTSKPINSAPTSRTTEFRPPRP
jgi:hypothetical protein